MSEWLALAIAMLAACAVVVAVVLLRHRRAGADEDTDETPDVIEYMTMMIGVVYAIVLGLAIAGVWETRGAAQDDVFREAQALHEVSARAQVYPVEYRDKIRADVDAYVSYVVDVEWTYMRENGEISDRGTELLDKLRTDVATRPPASDLEAQAYQPMLDRISVVDDARNARGQNSRPEHARRGLVRPDRRRRGDGGHGVLPPDPALPARVDPGRCVQCADRLPAVPDLGLRRPVRPERLGHHPDVHRSVPHPGWR